MDSTTDFMKAVKLIYHIIFLSLVTIVNADELVILHINDHHSNLLPDQKMTLVLGGEETRVISGGFPALITMFNKLSFDKDNVLKLHAGDAITGDIFYNLFKGEANALLMNEVCFDAFALGNHEFDDGDQGLVNFLDFLNDSSCNTEVLAANVIPEVGVSPLAPITANDYIKPYTIVERSGVKIGIIGIDIAEKTKKSSSPDTTTLFLDETKTAQKYIDKLKDQGVDRIVLLTHYQYENDLELAKNLKGVDIIIGGDSHSLLGDFENLGLDSSGPYPTIVTDSVGNKVCVAQAWQYSQIIGELTVDFNDDGTVNNCFGTPHMMLGDSFKRKDSSGRRVELEGPDREAVLTDINADPKLNLVNEDQKAVSLLDNFALKVVDLKQTKIANVSKNLCLERIPGQGSSKHCSVESTLKHGSDISNLVCQAFREQVKAAEIVIYNAGGIRVDIMQGPLTIGDAYKLLPFSSMLVLMPMTGSQIKAVLEDALDYAIQTDGSTGAYPYAAGLRWYIDANSDKGNRFSKIEYKGPSDKSWLVLDPNRTYIVVTNDFIAKGKDGYLTFATLPFTNTYLEDTKVFIDYARRVKNIDKLDYSDYSTQELKN